MTELALAPVDSMETKMAYSKALAVSRLLPKDYQQNPANILFALEFAAALHIQPIHAITSIHVINGKPAASADLIAGIVRRAGHKLRITSSDTEAIAVLIRADDPDFEYKAIWNMAKAKAAQLLSNPSWTKYPAAMLRSRAITEVCRQGASDALYGVVYTPEELGVDIDKYGAPVVDSRPIRPQPRGSMDRLRSALTEEPIDAVDADVDPDVEAQAEYEAQ